MKKFLFTLINLVIIAGLFLPKLALAISNDPGSDPSGKSQRFVIEKAPWYDPTECAEPVASSSNTTGPAKGPAYVIGDSITQNNMVQSKLKAGLENAGFSPASFNSLASRRLSTGSSDLDGISVFEKDVANWKAVKNIVIELGTNGGVSDTNVKEMMRILKANNASATVYWVNVGADNALRSTPIDTAAINNILQANTSLGYKVIDWKTIVEQNPQYILNDGLGVHPFTDAGSQAYSDAVVNFMNTNSGASAGNIVQTGCYCPAGVINNGFSGSNNVQIAFNFLNGKDGIKPYQAAGLVGNFMQESGVNLNTSALNSIGAFGIAQWLGGRKDRLIDYATSQGKEATDLKIQLEFVMIELNGSESAAFKQILATTNVDEAARAVEKYYERSGGSAVEQRVAYSQDVLRLYGGTNVIDNVVNNDCLNNPGSIGQAPNGFVFPLITTQALIKKGSVNDSGQTAIWCYQAPTSCHHDYPAADIHVNPGTVVVAAIGGKVVKADPNCPNNCAIQIKGTDQNLYYYAHMGGNSITVKNNDIVQPGQAIGKVGLSSDAEGTAPHLHFNIMNSNWDYMPTCFNSNCPNKADMIDPQPWLLAAFKYLPQ